MGCGKTTLGALLASQLKLKFVDLDELIEQEQKKTISQLFLQQGENVFREIETQCLTQLLKNGEAKVIALGGGTICNLDNLQMVKNAGRLIYIKLPASELAIRLSGKGETRPLLKGLKGDALISFVEKKLEERQNYYQAAHLKINALNLSAEQLLKEIIEDKQKNN